MNPTQFDWEDKSAIRALVASAEKKGWITRPVLKSPEEELAAQEARRKRYDELLKECWPGKDAPQTRHRGQRMRVSPHHHPEPPTNQ